MLAHLAAFFTQSIAPRTSESFSLFEIERILCSVLQVEIIIIKGNYKIIFTNLNIQLFEKKSWSNIVEPYMY